MTQEHVSADHIERDIEHTRGDINKKLDELQERLSPGQWIDQAVGYMKDGGGEFGRNLGRVVRENPVPVVLVCAGAAWLAASSVRKRSATDPDDRAGDTSGGAAYRAANGGYTGGAQSSAASAADAQTAKTRSGGVGDRIAGVGATVKDKLGAAKEQGKTIASDARERGSQTKHATQAFVQERPLAMVAIGLAVGAVIGAAFPVSRREHEVLGEKSDAAIQKAKEAASEQVDQAKEVAKDIANAAVQGAKDQAEEHGLPTGSSDEPFTGAANNGNPTARASATSPAAGAKSVGGTSADVRPQPTTRDQKPDNPHSENGVGAAGKAPEPPSR